MKHYLKKAGIYVVSVLGAAGTGLQNYMAVAALIKDIMDGAFAATKAGLGIIHGVAAVLGGLCSGLVNLCINIELLENFLERITQKPKPELTGWQRFKYWFSRPDLTGWQRFRYWAGIGVFITTGVLFGLTALAFGPIGPLAAVSIAAGIFVAAIMAIQELETWLESFDNPENKKKKTLKEIFKEWKESLTKSKIFGVVIAVGNVVALSLLFTMGLGTFLIGVGIPALPAVIAAFAVAFTGGAFTEFYFYNRFLANFCNNIKENWHKFWQTKYPIVGLICGAANAIVNTVLSYVGIMMITGLLTAAGIAVPPVGVVIAVAVTAAVFAGIASFILGTDFWIRNSEKLTSYFSKNKPAAESPPSDDSKGCTKSIMGRLKQMFSFNHDSQQKQKLLTEAVHEEYVPLPSQKKTSVTSGQFSIFTENNGQFRKVANDETTHAVEKIEIVEEKIQVASTAKLG